MDIRSLIKIAGLATISLSSAIFSAQSFANVNAETNSEDRFWIDRTYKNLSTLDNYQATSELVFSNTTISASSTEKQITPIVSDITFKSPDSFYQVVTQPETLKGYEASYSNNTITLYDVRNQNALQIKGLKPFEKKNAKRALKAFTCITKNITHKNLHPLFLLQIDYLWVLSSKRRKTIINCKK